MAAHFKFEIPKPCHEDWEKMKPNENGRFCDSCTKNVTDFTAMTPIEVQDFIAKNSNARICGRFNTTQLEPLTIKIPSAFLFSQTQYHKMFLLALLITMGTTLFSCADENGNPQKIDKVEVVEDTIPEHKEMMLGMIAPDPNDPSARELPPPPPPKEDQVKFSIVKK